jgi:hypothetical protein
MPSDARDYASLSLLRLHAAERAACPEQLADGGTPRLFLKRMDFGIPPGTACRNCSAYVPQACAPSAGVHGDRIRSNMQPHDDGFVVPLTDARPRTRRERVFHVSRHLGVPPCARSSRAPSRSATLEERRAPSALRFIRLPPVFRSALRIVQRKLRSKRFAIPCAHDAVITQPLEILRRL